MSGVVSAPIIPLGTVTSWGKVDMVGITGGERYYWMTDRRGVVSMMPADVVEKDVKARERKP